MNITDFLSYLESHPSTRSLGSTLYEIVDEKDRIRRARTRAPRRKAS